MKNDTFIGDIKNSQSHVTHSWVHIKCAATHTLLVALHSWELTKEKEWPYIKMTSSIYIIYNSYT